MFLLSFLLDSDRHCVCVEVAHLVTLRASWGINHGQSSSLCGISLSRRNAQLADFCSVRRKQTRLGLFCIYLVNHSDAADFIITAHGYGI